MAIKSLLPYLLQDPLCLFFSYINYLPESSKQLYYVDTVKQERKARPKDIRHLVRSLKVINAKIQMFSKSMLFPLDHEYSQ